MAGGGSTESRSPIILACGSLFVHDGCTFYGFGSPNYQGSTFVIMCRMWSDSDGAGSLYEQAGPAELSILPDNTWDGCGDKKRYFFLKILGRLSLKIKVKRCFISWTMSWFLLWLFRFDTFLHVIDLRCFWSYIVDCVMHMPDCKPEDQWGDLLRNADDSTKHCTEQHLCEITGL